MSKQLIQLLFLVIISYSINLKPLQQEQSSKIESPKPKRYPLINSWLNTFDEEWEKIIEENLEKKTIFPTIKIVSKKFSKIYHELQELLKKKRTIKQELKKARKAKVRLDIDKILKAMNEIRKPLSNIYKTIERMHDNSTECEQIINMYEELLDYLSTGLADYYL